MKETAIVPVPAVEESQSPFIKRAYGEELDVFREFISGHVREIGNADVQCMLLWSEWVRFHFGRTKKFPGLILETMLHDIITNLFHTTIVTDEYRGNVYPGIRFVP